MIFYIWLNISRKYSSSSFFWSYEICLEGMESFSNDHQHSLHGLYNHSNLRYNKSFFDLHVLVSIDDIMLFKYLKLNSKIPVVWMEAEKTMITWNGVCKQIYSTVMCSYLFMILPNGWSSGWRFTCFCFIFDHNRNETNYESIFHKIWKDASPLLNL